MPSSRRATSSRAASLPARGRPGACTSTQPASAGLRSKFPGAWPIATAAGFDPRRQPLPVAAAAHFHMGGIATDADGRDLAARALGLRRSGRRPACTVATGWPATRCSKDWCSASASRAPSRRGRRFQGRSRRTVRSKWPHRRAVAAAGDPARVQALRRLVGESLGPLRQGPAMAAALARLAAWRRDSRAEEDIATSRSCMLTAALERRESRGAHYRADYPEPAAGMPSRSFRAPPPVPVEKLEPAGAASHDSRGARTRRWRELSSRAGRGSRRAGDITTDAIVPAGTPMTAVIRSREAGRIAGVDAIRLVLSRLPEPASARSSRATAPMSPPAELWRSSDGRRADAAHRRARDPEPARPAVRHRDRDRRRRARRRGHRAAIKDTRKTTPGLRRSRSTPSPSAAA